MSGNDNGFGFEGLMGGITDVEGAKRIAKLIFERYDRTNNGEIQSSDIAGIMQDTYKDIGKGFNPSKADTDTYFAVMDANNDGKITLADLEALAIKFLVGTNQ